MRSAAQVRQEFIDFFCRRHGHTFVPSAPVVPHADPTLLFTNAGMNQFKPLFLGQADPCTEFGRLRRAANTQKCIRAGGKHNDLDDVGHDTYHHTFFEMLGNWSFGDYFKKEAITWAWELLTQVWGLDKDRLHATYFGGDAEEELEPDHEARDLWATLTDIDPAHIHPGGKKDNFWEMGETGPCGPCSEIHIDLTPDKRGIALVNAGDPRVIEIWNLVFIQFNRGADGKLLPLPARHVDTGMGFERVTALLQGKTSNYDTDLFVPIFEAIRKVTGAPAYTGLLESDLEPVRAEETAGRGGSIPDSDARRAAVMKDVTYRVVADHIRCLTFALTDGAVPDKEGRGYVLRRILRRAVRYGWQYLNVHEPFLFRLVDAVIGAMGGAFPELCRRPEQVKALLREEEEAFGRTLERGLKLFEEAADFARRRHHHVVRGEDAFKLHDTYGFPIDLTEIMAAERGLRVDIGEYERLMEEARERARACAGGFQEAAAAIPAELLAGLPPTDDSPKYTAETLRLPVRAIVHCDADGGPTLLPPPARLPPGQMAGLIFEQTCFYAEAGGQVGDRGAVSGPSLRFDVEDTRQIGQVVVHFGTLVLGELQVGQTVELCVDPRRRATMKNHTVTHLLNWALREVLGEHVQQKGSLVDAEKTRFDFAHPRALTAQELARVEELVSRRIAERLPVDAQVVPQAAALKINGLRAVFGEKYPDPVRVVACGAAIGEMAADPENPRWRQFPVELCGGTHVRNTAEIERCLLITEEAVAKGVRRIVAVTGPTAQTVEQVGVALLQRAEQLRCGPAHEVAPGVAELQQALGDVTLGLRQRARLHELIATLQEIVKQQAKAAAVDAAAVVNQRIDELLRGADRSGAATVIVAEMPDVPLEQLKGGADRIKQKCGSAAVLFGVHVAPAEERTGGGCEGKGTSGGGKALLLAAFTDDLIKRGLRAGDLVKAIAPIVGGGGGGPPTMAQAGGKNPAQLAQALQCGREWIAARLQQSG